MRPTPEVPGRLRLHDLMQHYCVLKFNSPTSGDVGIAEGGTAVSTWDQVLGDVQGKKEVVITLKVNKDTGKIDAPLIPGESSGDGKK